MKYTKRLLRAEVVAVALLFVVIIGLFFVSPSVGVADNGDFERVMRPVGLDYAGDISQNYFYNYSNPIFKMKNIFLWGTGNYATTQVIPIRIARIINRIFYSQEYFHTLSLAVVYSFFMLWAVYLIVRNIKTKNKYFNGLIVLFCVWIFGDATNLVYFNSLFGEACSYVFLLLMLGTGLEMIRRDFEKKPLIFFFFAAAMFFGSKLQYTLLSPLLLFIAVPVYKRYNLKKVISLCMGITIALSCLIYFIAPSQLGKDTKYNSVFFGVLKNSPNVEQDLKDLRLPAYMAPLAGTNAYDNVTTVDVEGVQFEKDFYEKVGRGKIMLFYLSHFDRLIDKMELTANKAYDNKIGMMGNYKIEDANKPHQLNDRFTSYNEFKKVVYPNSFWTIFLFYIVYFAYLIITMLKSEYNKAFYKRLLLLMILLLGVIQFPLPTIGNGEADIAKQLFIFNATFDIAVFGALYAFAKRLLRIKEDGID